MLNIYVFGLVLINIHTNYIKQFQVSFRPPWYWIYELKCSPPIFHIERI